MIVPRPQPGEFAAGMPAGYIARVQGDIEPVLSLERQRDRVLGQLRTVSEPAAAQRYAEGKWSIKQVVGHLTDAERIFAYRLLRIARGDETPLPGFEEDDYVAAAAFDDRPFSAIVAEWASVRGATLALVSGLPGNAWSRQGTTNNSPVSARALLYLIVGHTDHHLGVLESRYGVSPLA